LARYRLSDPAKADIADILRASQTRHGAEARVRYRGLLTTAMRRVAADPLGLSTQDRSGAGRRTRACRLLSRYRTGGGRDRPRPA
jgi:toxin ParE1/3/4